MGAFQENIAEAVKRELRDPRFLSASGLAEQGVGGRVFFVLKTAATNYAQFVEDHPNYKSGDGVVTAAAVYNTIDAAIGACTAAQGDVIYVMPGHTETISAAAAITADISGVSIIGLGSYDLRPQILMDTATTVDILVSAANVTFRNLVFNAGFADIVRAFRITAKGCHLDNVEFDDNAVDQNFLTPIKATSTTDNNADGLKVTNCKWFSVDAAGLEFIEANADIKHLVVENNVVAHEGTASPLVLFATGKDAQYCSIQRNRLSHKMTANELLVNIDTSANSGIIADNYVGHADVTTSHDLGIDGLGCRLFNNYSVSTGSLSGLLLPAADVDS